MWRPVYVFYKHLLDFHLINEVKYHIIPESSGFCYGSLAVFSLADKLLFLAIWKLEIPLPKASCPFKTMKTDCLTKQKGERDQPLHLAESVKWTFSTDPWVPLSGILSASSPGQSTLWCFYYLLQSPTSFIAHYVGLTLLLHPKLGL